MSLPRALVYNHIDDYIDRMKTEESKMYTAHSGVESPVEALRRASQTDDEVKDEIRAQLLPKTDGPRRASKKSTKKGVRAK
jgi:hypothetical protein